MDEEVGIGEVIQSFIEYAHQNKFTALPGVILNVHNRGSQQLVDVQPCVSIRSRNGEITDQATILNVPYQQPASSLGGTVFPVNKGDNVLLVFCMRGIDTWKRGDGGLAPPSDYRMFSNQDCIAIPCIAPVANTPTSASKHSGDYALGDTIIFNGGTEIIQKPDGTTIINSPQRVVVNSPNVVVNSTNVTINASQTTVNGTFTVNGNTSINGNTTISGNNSVGGNLGVSGQGSISGRDFMSHSHSGVEQGPSSTGGVV